MTTGRERRTRPGSDSLWYRKHSRARYFLRGVGNAARFPQSLVADWHCKRRRSRNYSPWTIPRCVLDFSSPDLRDTTVATDWELELWVLIEIATTLLRRVRSAEELR